ncbi:MAG: YveK family protein [Sarcina sp.]
MEEKTLNISEILYSIRKRVKWVIFSIVFMTLISTLLAFILLKPKYYATTKVFVGKNDGSKDYNNNEIDSYKQLTATYMDLVKTEDFIEEALKETGSDKTVGAVLGSLQLTASNVSPTMNIKVAGTNEEDARNTIDVVVKAFENITKNTITTAKIDVIDKTKTFTVKSNKGKFLFIGIILGVILSLGIIFVLDYLDNTIKSKKDLEELLKLPIIGCIPRENNL